VKKLDKIAVDSWSAGMFDGFPQAFSGAKFINGQQIMLGARVVKTWDEIQCLKMAHLMTMSGVQAGLEAMRPGMKECEVRAEIFHAFDHFGSEGAQTTNCIVCSGGGTVPYRRFTSDKIIDYGDLVIIDMGASFNGYYGDMTRVYVAGKGAKPSKRQVELHTAAYSALKRAEKAIKPGGQPTIRRKPAGPNTSWGAFGTWFGRRRVEGPFIGSPSPAAKAAARNSSRAWSFRSNLITGKSA